MLFLVSAIYVRQAAGTYLLRIVPDAAAALALILPAALQIHEIEPPDGTVEADAVPANAVPDATEPSTGVRMRVPPLEIVETYVMVMAPLDCDKATVFTLPVAAGEVQPESSGAPLAAFSETATLAEPAKDNPSVTFARTV